MNLICASTSRQPTTPVALCADRAPGESPYIPACLGLGLSWDALRRGIQAKQIRWILRDNLLHAHAADAQWLALAENRKNRRFPVVEVTAPALVPPRPTPEQPVILKFARTDRGLERAVAYKLRKGGCR